MLTIRRLNMDTSWRLDWDECGLILDPWLVGSEVDGFSWFNEQWHATPPVPIAEIDPFEGIIVSQSYSDHCHKKTLESLPNVEILATPSASKRLKKELGGRKITILPSLEKDEWLDFNGISLAYIDPHRKIDPIYNGVVIRKNNEAVVYFPHGFSLTDVQLSILKNLNVRLLITSFSLFRLPAFLGGDVNPGKENALELVRQLNPEKVVHTHDENKHARGLVKKIAKVVYPDPQELTLSLAGRYTYLQYEPMKMD